MDDLEPPCDVAGDLPGETYLNVGPKTTWCSNAIHMALVNQIIPNANHPLAGSFTYSISAFYQLVFSNVKRPNYTYSISRSVPSYLKLSRRPPLFSGINPVMCRAERGPEWDGKYVASMKSPPYGWTGFFVELSWQYEYPFLLVRNSLLLITHCICASDTMPFLPF